MRKKSVKGGGGGGGGVPSELNLRDNFQMIVHIKETTKGKLNLQMVISPQQ